MRNNLYKILAATLGIAMALTFSCSSGGDDGGGGNDIDPCSGGESVTINAKAWQKCNSEVEPSTGKSACHGNKPENCTKYGRLYDWEAAMTVCPDGWHLPSKEEWDALIDYVGGKEIAGTKLKATSGWNTDDDYIPGTDDIYFSALPGGYGYSDDRFYGIGRYGSWWSSSEDNSDDAYGMYMLYNRKYANWISNDKDRLLSVRCVEN